MTPPSDLAKNVEQLLKKFGDESRCRGCRATIWWFVHRNGLKSPYDRDLTNHFATCPKAGDFRKKK